MDDGSADRGVNDPIAELRSMLRAATRWHLDDAALGAKIVDLQARVRDLLRRDPAWPEVYRQAIVVAQRVLAVGNAGSAGGPATAAAHDPRVLEQLASSARRALSQTQAAWPGRLSSQVRNDFLPKVERSVDGLSVTSQADPKTGTTNFRITPAELTQFFAWLANLERGWAQHNSELVATRANEAIAMVLAGQQLGFTVQPARIHPPPSPGPGRPPLDGHTIDTPGSFALLGSGYRLVMSTVGGLSAVGFMAARMVDVGQVLKVVLPPIMGFALLTTLVVAAITIPRQRRQGLARLERDARRMVQSELKQALARRLQDYESSQLNDIRRHLSDEEMRLSALTNAVRATPVAGVDRSTARVSEQDLAELQGRWLPALEARLAALTRD